MTRLSDLTALRDRVSSLTGPDREVDGELALLAGWTCTKMERDRQPYWRKPGVIEWFQRAELPPYTASLDAAFALKEALLPGFDWILEHTNDGLTISALVGTSDPNARAFADTPVLALIRAILGALIAQEQENNHG
jgi:hypothetical protein